MATLAQWIEGARPRTLPAAVAPVLVGTAAAHALGDSDLGLAVLALACSCGWATPNEPTPPILTACEREVAARP